MVALKQRATQFFLLYVVFDGVDGENLGKKRVDTIGGLCSSTVAQNVTRFDHDFWVSGFSSTKLFAFLVSLSSFDTQTQLWQGCTKSHPTPHSSTVKSFNSIHSVRNDRK